MKCHLAEDGWKLTLDEYIAKYSAKRLPADIRRAFFALNHRAIVRQALIQGKPVPPTVLADYSDLTERHRLFKE